LTTELSRSGNFIVVERARMDKILEEMKLQLSGVTTGENAAELGKILNCEYLIVGSVSNFGVTTEGKDFIIAQQKIQKVKAEVDLRIIKVETGAIIYSAYGKGEIEKKISSNFGMGGTGGYDETLAGESLRIAIKQSVHDLIDYFSVY
jgi:curli biogenesis system outer membrane secretion channel CsgG